MLISRCMLRILRSREYCMKRLRRRRKARLMGVSLMKVPFRQGYLMIFLIRYLEDDFSRMIVS